MKALVSTRVGGPETLQIVDLPSPTPGPGEIRLRVIAVGVNFPDTLIIEDRYQFRPERPFSPGGEMVGEIIEIGRNVTGFQVGERVIALSNHGGMREETVVSASQCFRLPDGADAVEGAGLIFTYGTNMHGLIDRGRLKAGETLLVLGAAGGIGTAAVEIGKAIGARVVAAVSSEEKAAAARLAGADETVIYPAGPLDRAQQKALSAAFKAACGGDGADVIYDPVGGDYAEPALRAIAWGGRYCILGFPAGIPNLPFNLPLLKGCDICGIFYGNFAAREPEKNAAHMRQLFGWWQDGKIRPRIAATYPLEQGGEAIRQLAERRAVGKLVVKVGED